jgi:hypothetical protein
MLGYKVSIDDFVADVKLYRVRCDELLRRLYAADNEAFYSAYAPELSFLSTRNRQIFAWNALEMRSERRKSGMHYFVHQLVAAYILSRLVRDSDPDKEKSTGYVLTHDLVDQAFHYSPERFRAFLDRQTPEFLDEFRDELAAAILGCVPDPRLQDSLDWADPEVRWEAAKTTKTIQIDRFGNRAHAYYLLAEGADNHIDSQYMYTNLRQGDLDRIEDLSDARAKIARYMLAPSRFQIDKLKRKLPREFVGDMHRLAEWSRKDRVITRGAIRRSLRVYRSIARKHPYEISEEIRHHQERFGYAKLTRQCA